ncbi:MAG: type I-U CRISPR-associated protein Csx17 [Bacillota bacterium]
MHEVPLPGCRPEPLAHYLKGLAVLRLVGEQADAGCRGWWKDDIFWLRSALDREGLLGFFLQAYRPTPVVAPWNGGSGFFPKDRQEGIRPLRMSPAGRFQVYRQTIEAGHRVLNSLGISEKPDENAKLRVLLTARNLLSEEALAWMDAAVVLTDDGAKYPPLLGTGGNDGRLDFTNNFMQRLVDLFDTKTGEPRPAAEGWLRGCLFAEPVAGLQRDKKIGQFYPGAAGGANATTGFSGESLINPWDFVLMIEGALLFASAVTRRLGSGQPGVASCPFTVRAAGVGYGSAHGSDESRRGETWLPLWSNPASLDEVAALFSEGRAQVGRRMAVGGVDFARAVASLGVDRGIASFQRYGFQVRNGLAYLATPLGRWPVTPRPDVDLLAELDGWLDRFRAAAVSDQAPARMGVVLRAIERAIMDYCREGGRRRFAEIVMALGEAEATLAASPKFRKQYSVDPVPLLSPPWLEACDDGSAEFRVAAALGSAGIRENLEPVQMGRRVAWLDMDKHPRVVWQKGDLVRNLSNVLYRRCVDAIREGAVGLPLQGRCTAGLGDVAAFVRGEVDDWRLEALLRGLCLLDWSRGVEPRASSEEPMPPAIYGLLKLVHLPHPLQDVAVPWDGSILARAMAGDASGATRLAVRRLRGSGFLPLMEVVHEPPEVVRRAAAALLIPISERAAQRLADMVLRRAAQELEPSA